ncbi:MAG: dihydroorotase [Cyanobacteria bacterium P01_A01_bin.135]
MAEVKTASTYLLRQVRLLDPAGQRDGVVDVLIQGGCIQAIAPELTELPDLDAEVVTLERPGVLGPGLVDCYSHASDPGFETRETIDTLARSALAGGVTHLNLLPTTRPAVDHAAGLQQLRSRFTVACPELSVGFWGGLTRNLAGQQLSDLAELGAAGAIGFTNAGYLPFDLLYPALDYSQALGKPLALSLCQATQPAREGAASLRLGLASTPAAEEAAGLARLMEHLEAIPAPVHLMHLSTARGVALVAEAKERGLPVSASTSWLHLLRDTTHLSTYDPNLRVRPPLGNPEDREALVAGVASGVIDAIAIEHCPYTYEEKTVPFAEAPPGVIGLQTALPLLWQHLVKPGRLSALTLWHALSIGPARCLQLALPQLAVAQPANLVLFNPTERWQATPEALVSQAQNTPWLNQAIEGRVARTWTVS